MKIILFCKFLYLLASFKVFWWLSCHKILQWCENERHAGKRNFPCAQLRWRLRRNTRKPTGIKDLLQNSLQSQDAINRKTRSCRKTNLIISTAHGNTYYSGKHLPYKQRNLLFTVAWITDSWMQLLWAHLNHGQNVNSAQVLLYLHLLTRDIQMLICQSSSVTLSMIPHKKRPKSFYNATR